MVISLQSNSKLLIIIAFSSFCYCLVVSDACSSPNYTFPNNQRFKSCTDLPVLNAHLHWNYNPSNQLLQIAYRANQTPTGWVAWGINPTGTGMVGTQAIITYQSSSDATMIAYTTSIFTYSPSLRPANLSFPVSNISAAYVGGEMIIFAQLGGLQNSNVNHVWQEGPVSDGEPQMHETFGDNLKSMGRISFASKKL